jgi:Ca2+-binding RTX toxin-like protein
VQSQGSAVLTAYVKSFDGREYSAPRAITITVEDVNERPEVSLGSQLSVMRVGATGEMADLVQATWTDPDINLAYRDNLYRFANGTTRDGKFLINADTGLVTVGEALTEDDVAAGKTLTVVAYDRATMELQGSRTFAFDILSAAAAPVVEFHPDSRSVTHQEGSGGGTTACTFTLTRDVTQGVSKVRWALTFGTADGADFAAPVSGEVELQDGRSSVDVTVLVARDTAVEANETVSVQLSAIDGGNATIGANGSASGTILDDDAANRALIDIALSERRAAEYARAGDRVGTLTGTDPDGDALTFSLAAPDDRFDIVNGQLVVKNGFLLDYEQARSHNVSVKVTDGNGLSHTKVFAIGVTDVNPEVTSGTAGNDVFYGGALKDQLSGGAGNDRLFGGAGNDVIKGETGRDMLGGGLGKDKLYGGKGKASADTFVFDTKVSKASEAKKHVDTIYDFGPKYDSFAFDDAAFTNKTRLSHLR